MGSERRYNPGMSRRTRKQAAVHISPWLREELMETAYEKKHVGDNENKKVDAEGGRCSSPEELMQIYSSNQKQQDNVVDAFPEEAFKTTGSNEDKQGDNAFPEAALYQAELVKQVNDDTDKQQQCDFAVGWCASPEEQIFQNNDGDDWKTIDGYDTWWVVQENLKQTIDSNNNNSNNKKQDNNKNKQTMKKQTNGNNVVRKKSKGTHRTSLGDLMKSDSFQCNHKVHCKSEAVDQEEDDHHEEKKRIPLVLKHGDCFGGATMVIGTGNRYVNLLNYFIKHRRSKNKNAVRPWLN